MAFEHEFVNLYRCIVADNTRGIADMPLKPGVMGELGAVYRFAKAKSVAIVVGFEVPMPSNDHNSLPTGTQETDGPLGAAFMALGCLKTQKPVALICTKETQKAVEACLRRLDGDKAVNAVRFINYEPHDDKSAEEISEDIADKLARAQTDTLVAIEVAGRGVDGVSRNMGGIDINHLNPNYDCLIDKLGSQMNVIAIGDGGNEAGFGGAVKDGEVPPAPNGLDIQAKTGADYAFRASVSNWGGYGMYAGLMRLAGRTNMEMPSVDQHNAAIQEMLRKGFVDGCTKQSQAGQQASGTVNGRKVQWTTGVDGMSVEQNGKLYQQVRSFVEEASNGFKAGRFEQWDQKVVVALFDSSDGVLHAGKIAMDYFDAQLPGEKTYVLLGDHENAPYGTRPEDQIEALVTRHLNFLHKYTGDRPIVLACNTACIALDRKQRRGDEVVDINLVENTAKYIAKGAPKSVGVLATPAMIASGIYQREISALKAGDKNVSYMGCPDWADAVNNSLHESLEANDANKLRELIRRPLQSLPLDLDVLYLCCTHYPALTEQVEAVYAELRFAAGVTKPFVISNPMKNQAVVAVDKYMELGHMNGAFAVAPNQSVLHHQVPVVILTTAEHLEGVTARANTVLGNSRPMDIGHVSVSGEVIFKERPNYELPTWRRRASSVLNHIGIRSDLFS